MRDINDDLADRFAFLLKGIHDWHRIPAFDRAVVHALAAECVRQMEWTRVQYGRGEFFIDVDEHTRKLVDASELPITLAPEDWKPSHEES